MKNLNKIDLQDQAWIDEIFTGRNKAYGAYQLRSNYSRHALTGVALALLGTAAALVVPKAMALVMKSAAPIIIEDPHVFTAIPKTIALPVEPKTAVLHPRASHLKSQVFTPPVVSKDPAAQSKEPPALNNDLKQPEFSGIEISGAGTETASLPEHSGTSGAGAGTRDESIHGSAEYMPVYPGGESSLLRDIGAYLSRHYPREAIENKVEGRVVVGFVVETDGSISNIHILTGLELQAGIPEVSVEAIRKLKPFKPGMQNGSAVRVAYSVPLTFHLTEGE